MRGWGGGGEGRVEEYQDFPSKIFCPTVSKKFVGEPFYAVCQKTSGSQKIYGEEGGGVSRCSIEKFLSHSSEKIRRRPFVLSLISGIEKFYA